jgi:uncharacterized protein YecT (DUF1311 family)
MSLVPLFRPARRLWILAGRDGEAVMRRILVFAFFLAAVPAHAEDQIDCANAVAQMELNMCAYQDFEKADAELNAVWKEAKTSAGEMDSQQDEESMKGAAKALLAALRGWIAYRDGACELSGWEAHGGSMEPMVVSGCLAQMTRARTKELQDFLKGPEQ